LHNLHTHYLTCIHPFASLKMHGCVGDSLTGGPAIGDGQTRQTKWLCSRTKLSLIFKYFLLFIFLKISYIFIMISFITKNIYRDL
jgi:hypothetical protein